MARTGVARTDRSPETAHSPLYDYASTGVNARRNGSKLRQVIAEYRSRTDVSFENRPSTAAGKERKK